MVERSELVMTYGAEVEMLTQESGSGSLVPLKPETQKIAQQDINHLKDIHEEPMNIDYDSSTHLIEIGGGVHYELPYLVHSLSKAITTLQATLYEQQNAGLLSTSYHPTAYKETAYKNVLPKPMYDLWRGTYNEQPHLHPDVLHKVYPDKSEHGRGWQHEFTALAASIQPWNALKMENAAEQLALIQAVSWMLNLLTANSPFAERKRSGKRDTRLEIWKPMLATSRYPTDRQLAKNLPSRPQGLSSYFKYVFCNQRLMAVPCAELHTTGSAVNYKRSFRALVQPADNQEFNVLTYLSAKSAQAVDIYNGQIEDIEPSVAHVFNGYDFLYFPRGGARLRISLPHADLIDPRTFVGAIYNEDDHELQALLTLGGINEGFICIEGRAPATVLPTRATPNWQRFAIPFVLQTALLRRHKEVSALLENLGLTWQELTDELPAKTNDTRYGFQTIIRGIKVTELAQYIWKITKGSLSSEERNLVGDEIDEILKNKKAPAEEQLDLLHDIPDTATHAVWDQAFAQLIDHCTAITPTDVLALSSKESSRQTASIVS